jgi:cell division protein FtsW
MAVAVGLVPVTGQTLPLVSMGGSSIFFTSMATGMILSVSWGTKEGAGEKGKDESAEGAEGDEGQKISDIAEPVQPEGKSPANHQTNQRTEFEVYG